jgi:hypothetical protein
MLDSIIYSLEREISKDRFYFSDNDEKIKDRKTPFYDDSRLESIYSSIINNPKTKKESRRENSNNINYYLNNIYDDNIQTKKINLEDLISDNYTKINIKNYNNIKTNESFNNYNLKNNNIENIIKIKEYNSNNITQYIQNISLEGFIQKKINKKSEKSFTIQRDFNISSEEERKTDISSVSTPRLPGIVLEDIPLPKKYAGVLEEMQIKYPGARYVGAALLTNESQHEVEILGFEIQTQSGKQIIYKVSKQATEHEIAVNNILSNIGLSGYSFSTTTDGTLIMGYVGKCLRNVVRHGSHTEALKACNLAINQIAKIHILATDYLEQEINLQNSLPYSMPEANYNHEFRRRFVMPVSGNSLIISPQMNKLMQAYASFARSFSSSSFVHGDFHPGNCRLQKNEANIIDYEWAKMGMNFEDISRFINTTLRDRVDFDSKEFTINTFKLYLKVRNEYARENKMPLIMSTQYTALMMEYALINDELYKAGEYISFGETHPSLISEKIEKSASCMESALQKIDGLIIRYEMDGNQQVKTLSELRESVIDFLDSSPYQHMKEISDKYKTQLIGSSVGLLKAA